MKRRNRFHWILAAALVVSPITATASALYDVPEVADWVEAFWGGDPDEVIARVEENLAGDDPHPFASEVWVTVLEKRGALEERLARHAGDQVHQRVAAAAEVELLRRAGRHHRVVEQYADAGLAGELDPFTLSAVRLSADSAGREALAVRLLLRGIADRPTHFQHVWELTNYPVDAEYLRAPLDEVLASRAIPQDSPAATFLQAYLDSPDWTAVDRVEAGKAWLDAVPDDVRAMTMVGQSLNSLSRYREASDFLAPAFRRMPFYSNSDAYWRAMVRDGRKPDAQERMEAFMRGYQGDDMPWVLAGRLAGEERREGNHGAARRLLEAALARHPADPDLLLALARVEQADERHDQALDHLEQAIEQRTGFLEYWEAMLESARDSGRASEVIALYRRSQAADVESDQDITAHVSWAYGALEQHAERRHLMAEAVQRFPESGWMQREFALSLRNNDEDDEALRALLGSLSLNPGNAWAWARLREWAPDVVEEVAARHPRQRAAWAARAASADGAEGQLAVWREAIDRNPHAAFPWIDAVAVLTDARRWQDAMDLALEAEQALADARLSQRLAGHRLVAQTIATVGRHRALDAETRSLAEAAAEALRSRGGDLVDYHDVSSRIAMAREDAEAAAEHAHAAARMTLERGRFHDLVADHVEVLGFRAWQFGRQVLQREPMRGSVVESLMHKHVLWGGSAVVALQLLEEARERGVSETWGMRDMETRAYGKLGDSVRAFATYQRVTSVGESDRYIDWYDNAREAVRSDDRRRVRLIADAEYPTVDIVSADGSVLRRVHEPVAGKPLEIAARGGAWLRARYDDDGNLARVANAAGRWVELDYDDGVIVRARDDAGTDLAVAYNDEQRPSRIELMGVGAIIAEYEDDELSRVVSEDEDGGHQLALEVTQAFQRMLARINELTDAVNQGELPELPPTADPDHDRLYSHWQETPFESDEETRVQLELARHMVEHLDLRTEYAGQAREFLHQLIERGRREDASTVARDRVVPAIATWQSLISQTRPYGISSADYVRWVDHRRWLETAAARGDEDAESLLDAARATPELIDPPWHAEHDIENPGYWWRFGNADLLPEQHRTAEKRALLLRGNGDVVVGSNVGLSVRQGRHWVHYAFDPRQGTFNQPLVAGTGDPRSSVTALAETADGTLWVGTEDGLFALTDDYSGELREWRTERDGLPSPRITALAGAEDTLWVGTSAGLRRWDGERLTQPDSPVDGQAILQIDLAIVSGTEDRELDSLADELATLQHLVAPGDRETLHELTALAEEDVDAVRARRDEVLALLAPRPLPDSEMLDAADSLRRSIESMVNAWDREKRGKGERAAQLQAILESDEVAGLDEAARAELQQIRDRTMTSNDAGNQMIDWLAGLEEQRRHDDTMREDARGWIESLLAYDEVVTVRTRQGVDVHNEGDWRRIVDEPVDGAVYDAREDVFLVLRDDQVFAWPSAASPAADASRVPGEIRADRAVHALVRMHVPDVGDVPAVLTDNGISFFRDWHMTRMELPLQEQRNGLVVGPALAAGGDGGAWFATHEGVYGFASERGVVASDDRVHDLLSDNELGVTWVAREQGLGVVYHDRPDAGIQAIPGVRATTLALADDGALIANDGTRIVRIERGETRPRELFDARRDMPERWMQGPVKNILVAGDGAIWVAAGPSLFRYRDADDLTHFSWFDDPDRFPARSQMISRVVETVTGEIWAVASDEQHLSWRGVSLAGGLLQYNGDGFRRMDDTDLGDDWFVTGYTAIDDRTAVVGTTGGFVRHRDGQYAPFSRLDMPSYEAMQAETPALWLGRRGAELDGHWLFPSAGGVVMFNGDRWFYPDRLNQLLPEDRTLGQYGGRTVHAVAVDDNGVIYAGTDNGLMLYRTGGGVASLLVDNHRAETAFADHQTWQLREQREILLSAVRGNSAAARMVERILESDRDIDELERAGNRAEALSPAGASDADERSPGSVDGPALRERMRAQQQQRARLLARLERENFGLFQMLSLDPRELSALHRELGEDQAVIQYIPDDRALHIQVVTRDGPRMIEVAVERARIEQAARRVSAYLTGKARELPAYDLRAGVRGLVRAGVQISAEEVYREDVRWLYDHLIRPARLAIGDRRQVFVVPVGPLYYLPFAVLEDRETGEYALEQYSMGVLPSMYHLSLVLRTQPSLSDTALIIGDPDGSLPGARREADLVREATLGPAEILIGDDATVDAFGLVAPDSRIVHIATHGILDHERPEDSYLVMGRGERLDVVDIQLLPLTETDLVVLSACDTGIGRNGLEVATLARAFAHAQVPTVLASLWQVNDGATLALMEGFYGRLDAGDDHLDALANAQRALLARPDEYARPEAWAGFQVFGKP